LGGVSAELSSAIKVLPSNKWEEAASFRRVYLGKRLDIASLHVLIVDREVVIA
jgi:hypothetical protein